MFKSKKSGLRSYRHTFILLAIIIVIPLVFLIIAKSFLTAPPICMEYQELIRKAKMDENGYVFFVRPNTIAKRMVCGYFSSFTWKVLIPDTPDTLTFTKGSFKAERWPAEMFLSFYKFLIKENLFQEEMDAYAKKEYPISGPENFRERFCIYPEGHWIEDFLHNSQGILDDMKIVSNKDFFLPYKSDPYAFYSALNSEMLLIELVNVLLLLEKGEYTEALDWVETFNQVALKLDPIYLWEPSQIVQQLSIVSMIASYPSIPDAFYQNLLNQLLDIKEKIKTLEFKTVYKNALFYLEDWFVNKQGQLKYNPPQLSIPRSISLFFAYNDMARVLEKNREVFETSSWRDIENAVFYNQGKVYNAINEIKSIKRRAGLEDKEYWMFWSGEKYRNMLLRYNQSLCSIYGSILKILLERYFKSNGVYPKNLDDILQQYFTEEELIWMDDYLDIYLSSETYFIDFYPIPKKERESVKSKIFDYRKSYRIRSY